MLFYVLRDVVLCWLLGLFVELAMAGHGLLLVHKGARGRIEDGIWGLRVDRSLGLPCRWL
jgi:hypothetical protein